MTAFRLDSPVTCPICEKVMRNFAPAFTAGRTHGGPFEANEVIACTECFTLLTGDGQGGLRPAPEAALAEFVAAMPRAAIEYVVAGQRVWKHQQALRN